MPLRTLVQFAHPALERSRVNQRLFASLASEEGSTFNDLYEHYPRFSIDVAREQELLASHDLIVFQFPFYWYSVPALLKEWMDLVLQPGWAYAGGLELADKRWLTVVTTGGTTASYEKQGKNRFTMRELLSPLEQTAYLCGMHFLPPLVFHGALSLSSEQDVEPWAADYHRAITEARRDDLELAWMHRSPTMQAWMNRDHGAAMAP